MQSSSSLSYDAESNKMKLWADAMAGLVVASGHGKPIKIDL